MTLDDDKHICKCKKLNNILPECINEYTISEQGKTIRLIPKHMEKAVVYIIDNCLIKDEQTKCDAIFLFQSNNKKVSFLTELKGAGDIPKAFEQLSYTRNYRQEYKKVIKDFIEFDKKKVIEKFFIVTNGILEKKEREKLEEENQIRVSQILYSEPTSPIPNLRDYI